jgi:hypothetical protein
MKGSARLGGLESHGLGPGYASAQKNYQNKPQYQPDGKKSCLNPDHDRVVYRRMIFLPRPKP